MFHQADNLFFGRTASGAVRILKFTKPPADWPLAKGTYEDAAIDIIIPMEHWASIVASVSALGEEGLRFYKALDFHNGTR